MARVLVVANKTAATPGLLDAVRERAGREDAQFTLLVPNTHGGLNKITAAEHDMEADEPQQVIALAKPLLQEAAGGEVETMIGDPNPLDAIQDAVNLHGFDEIIISTLPTRVSRWLHLDLPSKLNGLRPPLRHATAAGRG